MNKQRNLIPLIGLSTALIVAVSAIGVSGLRFTKALDAASKRTMTFNSSHISYTTSAGNTFSSYWIDQPYNSGFSKGSISCLAYMEGSATHSAYDQPYVQKTPCFGIKGDFNISNVSKLEIDYKLDTSFTVLYLYRLAEDGSLSNSFWEIASTLTGLSDEQTKTITITGSNSYYGFAFKVIHSAQGGGMNDKMRAYVKSFKITYSC